MPVASGRAFCPLRGAAERPSPRAGDLRVRLARRAGDLARVRRLFEAYAASLPVDLGYQGFAEELAFLPGKYAEPDGCLLLASRGDQDALGCVGLRPLNRPGSGEMKRLFVADAARGSGLGLRLARRAIVEARHRGYSELLLDTLASMTAAISLYRRLGFESTPAYYGPVPAGTVFLAKRLAARDRTIPSDVPGNDSDLRLRNHSRMYGTNDDETR